MKFNKTEETTQSKTEWVLTTWYEKTLYFFAALYVAFLAVMFTVGLFIGFVEAL